MRAKWGPAILMMSSWTCVNGWARSGNLLRLLTKATRRGENTRTGCSHGWSPRSHTAIGLRTGCFDTRVSRGCGRTRSLTNADASYQNRYITARGRTDRSSTSDLASASIRSRNHGFGKVPSEAQFSRDSRAERPAGQGPRAADLRRPGAPCHEVALRLPPGGRWRAQELGGAQRAIARPRAKAAGGARGRPSAGIRNLQGHDSRRALWGREGIHLGSWHLREYSRAKARAAHRV